MKYRHHCNSPDLTPGYTGVVQLWIFRMLNTPKGRSKFICPGTFRDDDVAEYIGMGELVNLSSEKFDAPQVREEFKRRAGQAEADARSTRLPATIAENFRKLARL